MLRAKSLGLLLCLLLSPFAAQASYIGGAGGGATNIITTATDYYVCANTTSCNYNGNNNASVTPSDSNNCLTPTTPCLTINGVATLLNGKILAAVVTIHLADTAGTGTDCYRPNGTVFNVMTVGRAQDAALGDAEAGVSGNYPASYLYLLGNTTTPSSVKLSGATTCAGTTGNDNHGVIFQNGAFRVRGIQAQYFASNAASGVAQNDFGALEFYEANAYAEDLYCLQGTSDQGGLIIGYSSRVRLGSSLQWSVTNCMVWDVLNNSHISTLSPLGRWNVSVTAQNLWTTAGAIFLCNESSHCAIDGASITVAQTGTTALTVYYVIANSSLTWNDTSTFQAPAMTHTYNGGGLTLHRAQQGGYVSDFCRTAGSLTCNIGNTTGLAARANASENSYIRYLTQGTATATDTVSDSSFIYSPTRMLSGAGSTTFANLGTPANGAFTYCSDCTFANPCAGAGTGAIAKRLNGAWRCD